METWNREELYTKIWASPATHVAKEYGVSDVAIAKACRKLQIPVPGRGYWAKKQSGRKVEIKPLPKLKQQIFVGRQSHTVSYKLEHAIAVPQIHEDDRAEWEKIDRLFSEGAFQFAPTPQAMQHPLVLATRKALRNQRPNDRKMVSPHRQMKALDLDVSIPNLERALEFYACLIDCVRKHSGDVAVEQDERHRGTHFQAYAEKITVRVFESAHQRFLEADDPQLKGNYYRPRFAGKPIEYVPTQKLTIETGGYGDHLPRVWREGRTPLPELFPDIVRNLFKHALLDHRRTLDRLEEVETQRQREAELRLLRRQIEEEKRKVFQLMDETKSWKMAKRIREYVLAVIEDRKQKGQEAAPDTPLGKWVSWARQQADRFDPLAKSPPSILDRETELEEAPEGWRIR